MELVKIYTDGLKECREQLLLEASINNSEVPPIVNVLAIVFQLLEQGLSLNDSTQPNLSSHPGQTFTFDNVPKRNLTTTIEPCQSVYGVQAKCVTVPNNVDGHTHRSNNDNIQDHNAIANQEQFMDTAAIHPEHDKTSENYQPEYEDDTETQMDSDDSTPEAVPPNEVPVCTYYQRSLEFNNHNHINNDNIQDHSAIANQEQFMDTTATYPEHVNTSEDYQSEDEGQMDTTPEVVSPKVGPVYTCYQCDLKFNNKPQHDNHLHEVHQKHKKGHYKCKCCFYQSSLSDMHKHLFCHINEEYFKCSECPISFTCEDKLHKHLKKAHKTATNVTFACNSCLQVFETSKDLRNHVLGAHLCDRLEDMYEKIKSHDFYQPMPTKDAKQCQVCTRFFKTEAEKRQHQMKEHDYVKCGHCNKVLKNSRGLKDHCRKFHS